MKRLLLLLLACTALLPGWSAEDKPREAPLPVYECRKIDRELTLTGKMDDPAWQKAAVVDLVDSGTGLRAGFSTRARLLWSGKYLYLGFECEDDYAWGTYVKRDEPIYMEEAVEIFVSPTGKVRQYYEIEVSPLNTILDTYVLNGKSENNRLWDNFFTFFDYDFKGLITKVSVEGELNKPRGVTRWTVEMAIPFLALIGNDAPVPAVSDEWRMNLHRVDVPKEGRPGQYAWSPILQQGDFHRPWRFGVLKFVK